jgi:predicted adenylyl cyclase CyaB
VARNVEIKARTLDLPAIRARAARLSTAPGEILAQTDTFFAVPEGRLKVRELADGSGELIAYSRPDQPAPKESVYTRVACEEARDLAAALACALPLRGVVVKRREVFLVGRTRIHLDEVEGLGCFVEIEVVLGDGEGVERGQQEARDLLRALEIPATDLVASAYIDLLGRRATSADLAAERGDR